MMSEVLISGVQAFAPNHVSAVPRLEALEVWTPCTRSSEMLELATVIIISMISSSSSSSSSIVIIIVIAIIYIITTSSIIPLEGEADAPGAGSRAPREHGLLPGGQRKQSKTQTT